MNCSALLLALVAATPATLLAQANTSRRPQPTSPDEVSRAVETITVSDFSAKLGALAHDSTRGRETPSPELDRAADWIAARFRQAALRPAGDDGSFLQRFRLLRSRLDTASTATVSGPAYTTRWSLVREFLSIGGVVSDVREVPVVLMVGMPADVDRPFGDVAVRSAAVLLVLPRAQMPIARLNQVTLRAASEGVAALGVLTDMPAANVALLAARLAPENWTLAGASTVGERRTGIYMARLDTAADFLRAAGEDPDSLLASGRSEIRPLPGFTFSVTARQTVPEELTFSNVVGVIEGSDPTLRDEAVVFTSHYDHVGLVGGRCQASRALPADSTCNGADDNASGTAGIIEIAEAFAGLRPRPARTLVFAALSAEERGLFGAHHYVAHPVVPIERTAAVINLDMIARNPRDSVGLVGKDYTSLGGVVDRVLREHPELALAPKAHPPGPYQNSDHYPFAQSGVPALFFFSGIHPDLHTAADNVDRADVEGATLVARLAFLVGLEVANAVERPTWDPQARARIAGR